MRGDLFHQPASLGFFRTRKAEDNDETRNDKRWAEETGKPGAGSEEAEVTTIRCGQEGLEWAEGYGKPSLKGRADRRLG